MAGPAFPKTRDARRALLLPQRLAFITAMDITMTGLLIEPMNEPARQERGGEIRSGFLALLKLWSYRAFIAPMLAASLFSVIALHFASVWAAPVRIRTFGQTPGRFAGWLSGITLAGGIVGALAGGRLAKLARRRGGLPLFAVMLGLELFCAGLISTIGIVALTLNIPNEIRGLCIGAYMLVVALFGTATAPMAIAFVCRALGDEAKPGQAIARVSAPSAVASAICFGFAMRSDARLRRSLMVSR